MFDAIFLPVKSVFKIREIWLSGHFYKARLKGLY